VTRSQQRWWALFATAAVANLVLLYWPRAVGAGGVPHLDKLAHAVSFALLMWAGARAGLPVRALAVVLAVHAAVSEAIQHWLLAHRSGDLADVLADLVGVTGVVLALGTASWRHERGRAHQRGTDGEAARGRPGPG